MGHVSEGRQRLREFLPSSAETITTFGEAPAPELHDVEQSVEESHWWAAIFEWFGHRREARPDFIVSEPILIEIPNFSRIQALNLAAGLAMMQSDLEAAASYLEEVRKTGERCRDERMVRDATVSLALLPSRSNRSERERIVIARLTELSRESSASQSDPRLLISQAAIFLRQGDLDAAKEKIRQAYGIVSTQDNTNLKSAVLGQLAVIAERQGNRNEAARLYNECEDYARQTGLPMLLAAMLNASGQFMSRQGRFREADIRLKEALEIAERSGIVWVLAGVLRAIGENAFHSGRSGEAVAAYKRLLDIAAELGSPQMANDALVLIARSAVAVGAKPYRLEEATAYFNRTEARSAEAGCLIILGDWKHRMAKYEEALKAFEEARKLFEAAGDNTGVGNTLIRIGNAYRERGDYAEAEQTYHAAENMYKTNGVDSGVVNAMRALADLFKRQRKIDQAKQQLQATLDYCRETKQPQAEASAMLALGDLLAENRE
jgi:tetratricopeptide (TPR) repeat protein